MGLITWIKEKDMEETNFSKMCKALIFNYRYRKMNGKRLEITDDSFDTIINALEKQVPQKVCKKNTAPKGTIESISWVGDSIYTQYICPTCENKLEKSKKYCDKCGQAIDWSE